jgi:hypothetical protein
MRHIPLEVLDEGDALQWAERSVELLEHIRERYQSKISRESEDDDGAITVWTRLEAVTSLFWTKVVSLLRAASKAEGDSDGSDFSLVHTAFSTSCSLPPVAKIVATLFPSEMTKPDKNGRLPLHHAARRSWHAWDWPREDGIRDSANARLLQTETAAVIKTAMALSPPEAARHRDSSNRLPLHYVISTFVRACIQIGRSCSENVFEDMLEIIKDFVQMNPESLQERDPVTGLYPFEQASVEATEKGIQSLFSNAFPDELPLSIVYILLRECPSLVKGGIIR